MNKCFQNILIKTSELYKRYGIRSITMDDIAKELGISKRTLYEHVDNKDELVKKVYELEDEQRKKEIKDLLSKDKNAIEELFLINSYVNQLLKEYNQSTDYDLKKYYPELYEKIKETKKNNMYHSFLENIKKGKKEGLFREDVNEKIIAKLWVSRFASITDNEVFSIPEFTSHEIFMELFIYHIRGISNQKGMELLEKNLNKLKYEEL